MVDALGDQESILGIDAITYGTERAMRALNSSGSQIAQAFAGRDAVAMNSHVQVVGRQRADVIIIDAKSFFEEAGRASHLPVLEVDGNGGRDKLIITGGDLADGGRLNADWYVDNVDRKGADGHVVLTYTGTDGVERVGMTVSFEDIDFLRGTKGDDTFHIRDESISHRLAVVGGKGTFDSLVIEGDYETTEFEAIDGHDGAIILDGAKLSYRGLEPITHNGATDNLVIDLSNGNDVAELVAIDADTMRITTPATLNPTFENVTFTNPTESLTINLRNGDDTLDVRSLSANWAADLFIYGEVEGADLLTADGGTDSVTFSGSIDTGGGSMQVIVESIAVADDVQITADDGTGGSYVEFRTRRIGTADLENLSPIFPSSKSASVDIGDRAQITSGGVYLIAQAEERTFTDQLEISNALAQNLTGALLDQVSSIIELPFKVLVKKTEATIDVGAGAKLIGSSGVGVYANAVTIAEGSAGFQYLSAGWADSTSTSRVDIATGAELRSDNGFVVVTSDASSTAGMSAATDTGLTPSSSSNAVSLALAVSRSTLSSTLTLAEGATVTAGQTANLKAGGTVNSTASATSGLFASGAAGAALSVELSDADVHTNIYGSVTSKNIGTPAVKLEFDPTAAAGERGYVDIVNDRIYVGENALVTEDTVTYTSSRGNNIGGLVDGAEYYVLKEADDAATPEREDHWIQLARFEGSVFRGEAVDLTAYNGVSPDYGYRSMLTGMPLGGLPLLEPLYTANNTKDFTAGDVDYDENSIVLPNGAGSGSGTNFTWVDQTFGLGQAVFYHAEPGAEIDGLVDGNMYYVITGTNQFNLDGGSRLNFGTGQTIQLAETENEALAGIAIDIDRPAGQFDETAAFSLEAAHILDSGFTTGVGVTASLDVETATEAGAGLSSQDSDGSDAPNGYNLSSSAANNIFSILTSKLGNSGGGAIDAAGGASKGNLAAAVSLAFAYNDHDVTTDVHDSAVLKSGEDLEVKAEINHINKGFAQSATESQEDNGQNPSADTQISAAVILTITNNDALATVHGGADLDALRATRVISGVTYPFAQTLDSWVPTTAGEALDLFKTQGYEAITQYFDGTFGLAGFLNSWSSATTSGSGSDSLSIAGSANIQIQNTTAKSTVKDGAQINQDDAFHTDPNNAYVDQEVVSIEATSYMQMIDMAGIFGLSPGGIGLNDLYATRSGLAFDGGTPFDVDKPSASFNTAGRGGVGATIYAKIMDNDTHAIVEDRAAIYSGASGGFNMKAEEALFNLSLAQSGAAASGGWAVGGTISVLYQDSDTLVQLGALANVTGRDARLYAGSLDTQIGITGGLFLAEATGVGVSVAVNDITRNTRAVIGTETPVVGGAYTVGTATNFDLDEQLSVRAINDGAIWGFSIAGAVAKTDPGEPQTDDPLDGQSLGILFGDQPPDNRTSLAVGAAGSVALNFVDDTTLASITSAGEVAAGTLEITSLNESQIVSVSGAFGIAISSGQQGGSGGQTGIGIAGAISANTIAGATRALVLGTKIDVEGDADILAERTGDIFSLAASLGAAATDGPQSATAVGLAISVGVNLIRGKVQAIVEDSGIDGATGDISIKAKATPDVLSISGALAFSLSSGPSKSNSAAVGVAISVNEIGNGTETFEVTAAADNATVKTADGDVEIVAEDEAKVENYTYGVALAISGGSGSGFAFGGAGSISVNTINTTLRARATAGSTVSAVKGQVSITSTEDSEIDADAGGFGIALGTKGSNTGAMGLSIGINNLTVDSKAEVSNATVTGGTTSNGADNDVVITSDVGVKVQALTIAGAGAVGAGDANVGLAGTGSGNDIRMRSLADVSDSTITGGDKGVLIQGAITDTAEIKADAGGVAVAVGIKSTASVSLGVAVSVNKIRGLEGAATPAVGATVEDTTVTTDDGDVTVGALSAAKIDTFVLGVSVAVNVGSSTSVGFAGAGSIAISDIDFDTTAELDGTSVTSTGGGDVAIFARDDSSIDTFALAGTFSFGFGSNASVAFSLAASISVNEIDNGIIARVTDSDIATTGDVTVTATTLPATGETASAFLADLIEVKAANQSAVAQDRPARINAYAYGISGAVSVSTGAVGAGVALAGGFAFNDISNTITAEVTGDSSITGGSGGARAGSVTIQAIDAAGIFSSAVGAALSVSVGSTGSVSISIGVYVSESDIDNTISARVSDSTVHATNAVKVEADSTASVESIAVGAAASIAGSAEVSVAVALGGGYSSNDIDNDVTAEIVESDGTVEIAPDTSVARIIGGSVEVLADETATVDGVAVAASFALAITNPKSGVSIAVSAAAAVVENEVGSDVLAKISGSNVETTGPDEDTDGTDNRSGDVRVAATSLTTMTDVTVAAAISVTTSLISVAVSGAVVSVENKASGTVKAETASSDIAATGDVTVKAIDTTSLSSIGVGASVAVGVVSVAGAVVLIDNEIDRDVSATMTGTNVAKGQTLSVIADSDQDVVKAQGVAASLSILASGAGVESSAEVKSDTIARITGGEISVSGDVLVDADATSDAKAEAQGGSLGALSISVMLADAIVSGTVTGAITGGANVTGRNVRVTADSSGTVDQDLVSVAVGSYGGGGAGGEATYSRSTLASIGHESGVTSRPSVTAVRNGDGTGEIDVHATSSHYANSEGIAIAVTATAGAAAVVSPATVSGDTTARIQSGSTIIAHDVDVQADSLEDSYARGRPFGFSLGVTGVGTNAEADVSGTTAAYIGAARGATSSEATTLTVSGRTRVHAEADSTAEAEVLGVSGSLTVAIAAMLAETDVSRNTSAVIGSGTQITGGDVEVTADAFRDADTDTLAAAVSLGAGGGGDADAFISGYTEAIFGRTDGTTGGAATWLRDGGDVEIKATESSDAFAYAHGGSGGAIAIAALLPTATVQTTLAAYTGASSEIVGDSLTVEVEATKREATVDMLIVSVQIGGGAGTTATAWVGSDDGTADATAEAYLGANSIVDVTNDVTVKSDTLRDYAFGEGEVGSGGGFAVAVLLADSTVNATSMAWVGANAEVAARNLTVETTSQAGSGTENLVVSAAALGGRGVETNALTNTETASFLDAGAKAILSGDLRITAVNVIGEAKSKSQASGGGGIDVGAAISNAEANNDVEAFLGSMSQVEASNVLVSADVIPGNLPAPSEAVGMSASTNAVTYERHGLGDGDTVQLVNAGGANGLYAVVSVNANDAGVTSTNDFRLGAVVEIGASGENSDSVDLDFDTITFATKHRFTDNATVVYRSVDGADIGGLVDGSSYRVRVVDDYTIRVAAADSVFNAADDRLSFSGSVVSSNQIDPTGTVPFDDGQAVTYNAAQHASTFAHNLVDVAFSGNEVELTGGDNPDTVETDNNTIFTGRDTDGDGDFDVGHGFTTGELVIYEAVKGETIGGLVSGRGYYVIADTAYSLRLAATYHEAVGLEDNAGNVIIPVTAQELVRPVIPADASANEKTTVHSLTRASSQALVGLTEGKTYYIDQTGSQALADGFGLVDQDGNAVTFSSSTTVTLEGGTVVPVNLTGSHTLDRVEIDLTSAAAARHEFILDLDLLPDNPTDDTDLGLQSDEGLSLRDTVFVAFDGQTKADARGGGGGALAFAFPSIDVQVVNEAQAFIDSDLVTARGDVTLSSLVDSDALGYASNGGGGGIYVANTEGDVELDSFSTTAIGGLQRLTSSAAGGTNHQLLAQGGSNESTEPSTQVQAQHVTINATGNYRQFSQSDFETSNTTIADGGGLIAGAGAHGDNIADIQTVSVIGVGAEIDAGTVDVTANLGIVPALGSSADLGGNTSMYSYARAEAGGLFGGTRATIDNELDIETGVFVEGVTGNNALVDGTLIRGRYGVDFEVDQRNTSMTTDGKAVFYGIGAGTKEFDNTLWNNSLVDADAGVTVFAAPRLVGNVNVHPNDVPLTKLRTFSGYNDMAVYVGVDTGTNGGSNINSGQDRIASTIEWDGDIEISAGPSPELVVDSNGNVLRAINVKLKDAAGNFVFKESGTAAGYTSGGETVIEVANIVPTNAGSVVMDIGNGRIEQDFTNESATKFWGELRVLRNFDEVRLTNLSDHDLIVNRIDMLNETGQARLRLIDRDSADSAMKLAIKEGFGDSLIDIRALGAGDVILSGDNVDQASFENPFGETRILVANGDLRIEDGAIIRTNTMGDGGRALSFKDFEFLPEARVETEIVVGTGPSGAVTIRRTDGADWAAMGVAERGLIRVGSPGLAADGEVFQVALVEGDTLTLTRAASLAIGTSVQSVSLFHGVEATKGDVGSDAGRLRVDLVRQDSQSEAFHGAAGDEFFGDLGLRVRTGSLTASSASVSIGVIAAARELTLFMRSALRENASLNGRGVLVDGDSGDDGTYHNFFYDDRSGVSTSLGRGSGYDVDAVELASTTWSVGLAEAGSRITLAGIDPDGLDLRDPGENSVSLVASTNIIGDLVTTGTTGNFIDAATNGAITLTEIDAVRSTDGDDLLIGKVVSSASTVTLTAPDGIFDGDPTDASASAADPADVVGTVITMTAGTGAIGSRADFVETNLHDTVLGVAQTGHLTATAAGEIRIRETAGDLRLNYVASLSDDVTLATESGSILDATNSVRPDVSGVDIDLFANGGSIGLFANDLDVDTGIVGPFSGRLYAFATGDVFITETADEMRLLGAIAITGRVRLTVPDEAATPILPRGLPNATTSPADDLLFDTDGSRLLRQDTTESVDFAQVNAALWAAMWVGDNVAMKSNSRIIAGTTITMEVDTDRTGTGQRASTEADPGFGSNVDLRGEIRTRGTENGDSFLLRGGRDVDLVTVNDLQLDTQGYIRTGGQEDEIVVNTLRTMTTGRANGLRDALDIDGQAGTDVVVVNTTGTYGLQRDYVINVLDTGAPGDGADTLAITGSDGADVFLLRRITSIAGRTTDGPSFVALLHADADGGDQSLDNAIGQAQTSSDRPSAVQRINYDRAVNGRLSVLGLGGDDMFAVDGNSTTTTLDAGMGSDRFQIGQLHGVSDPSDPAGLPFHLGAAPGDTPPEVVRTTRGYLTSGALSPLVAKGGDGDDTFTVYSNKAEIRLEGDAGNDLFVVRAFALADENFEEIIDEYSVEGRNIINTGTGEDLVRYNLNAPVSIDGGTGFDKVVILGTEFGDAFVIREDGVFGAGVNVSFENVEVLEVDGLEGDDEFFVQSTPIGVAVRVIGNLGSDTINVAGDVTKAITSVGLEGTSGVINHGVLSNGSYAGVTAEGVELTVGGTTAGPIDIREVDDAGEEDNSSIVREGDFLDRYEISLNQAIKAGTVVYVTVSASRSSDDEDASDPRSAARVFVDADRNGRPDGGDSVLLGKSSSGFFHTVPVNGAGESVPNRDIVLRFDSTNYDQAQSVWLSAVDDDMAEGTRKIVVSHTVKVVPATDGDAEALATYDELAVRNVEVTVLDNDQADVILTPTGPDTRVLEGPRGFTDQIGVSLSRAPEPGEIVTVDLAELLAPDTARQLSFSATTLTFDATNWATMQMVQITAIDDSTPEDPRGLQIEATVSSTGGAFEDVASAKAAVKVLDNDTPSVVVTESGGETRVTPTTTDTYTLRLAKAPEPGEVVTIPLLDDGQTEIVSAIGPLGADRLIRNVDAGVYETVEVSTGRFAFSGDTIQRTDQGSFLDDGWEIGDLLAISGTTANDTGEGRPLTIAGVFADRLVLETAGLTAETTGSVELARASVDGFYLGDLAFGDSALGDTITRLDGGSWLADGFLPGHRIRIDSGANAGIYQIALLERDDQDREFLRLVPGDSVTAGTATAKVTRVADAIRFDATNWDAEVTITVRANDGYELPANLQDKRSFASRPHLLTAIQGPLSIEGGSSGADRTLVQAIILPGETPGTPVGIGAQPDEMAQIDVVNIFDDGSREDKSGVMTSTGLKGFGMAIDLTNPDAAFGQPTTVPGGISWGTQRVDSNGNYVTDPVKSSIEVLNLFMGQGNDILRIDGTLQGADEGEAGRPAIYGRLTTIHGGGNRIGDDGLAGGDRIMVDGGGGPDSLLVLYGDTSQDGVFYSGDPDDTQGRDFGKKPFPPFTSEKNKDRESRFVLPLAGPFLVAGRDEILVTARVSGALTVDAANRTIRAEESWAASGFRIGREVILSDADGAIGTYRIEAISGDGLTIRVEAGAAMTDGTVEGFATAGAAVGKVTAFGGGDDDLIMGSDFGDHLAGGGGNDRIFGRGGHDQIWGDSGFNVDIFGDLDVYSDDSLTEAQKRLRAGPVLTVAVSGALLSPSGDRMVVGDDTIRAGVGDDIVFGDHGRVDVTEPPLRIRTTSYDVITAVSTEQIDKGGDDMIFGGYGADMLMGGANRVTAGGLRGGDRIDGGEAQDLIFGDNARLTQRPADIDVRSQDGRIVQLTASNIYDADGSANLDLATRFSDPRHVGTPWSRFEIRALYHDTAQEARNDGQYGDDDIAGGASHDKIFAQLGNDTVQGDGAILAARVGAGRDAQGRLVHVPSFSRDTDGSDYVEGGGGNDVIFGNLGQDDLIGGSSSLYTLTAPGQRPDGSDIVFGGSGPQIEINELGTGADSLVSDIAVHGRDADTILGDNGNIFTLVNAAGGYLIYNYDQAADIGNDPDDPLDPHSRGTLRLIPRATVLLDYAPGNSTGNLGASDLIFGEDGDDVIHAMTGNDVVYGNGHDDQIQGGIGDDRLFGGTGEDGLLGDDGVIRVSRNGIAEPLNGIDAEGQQTIALPGPWTGAVIDIDGLLKITVDAILPQEGGDDILYGGLGDDFVHGGAGDDAASGAEALEVFYLDTRPIDAAPLAYDASTGILYGFYDVITASYRPFYDPENPRPRIENFYLNFLTFDAGGTLIEDGKDAIFGGYGNDAIFGGTGHDRLFGGWGDDYLQLDDNLGTNGGLNDTSDSALTPATTGGAADFGFGGAGRDVLIANSGTDRMYDWVGEFNSYIVPFSRFGAPTVNRLPSPHVVEFLIDLAGGTGAGMDRADIIDTIGLVTQRDPAWQDQTGAPRDPQPGNGRGAFDSAGGPEDDTQRQPLQTAAGSTPTAPAEGRGRPGQTTPAILVEKAVNAADPWFPTLAEDADTEAEAVRIAVGGTARWTYLVSNVGSEALKNVKITDESGTFSFTPVYVSGDIDSNGILDIGETWLYTSEGVGDRQVTSGLYSNEVTVSARPPTGRGVSDTDMNYHFGTTLTSPPPVVRLEKAINAVNPLAPTHEEDADTGPGPSLVAGSTVRWTYLVNNLGSDPVRITRLTDDMGTPDTVDDRTPVYVSGDVDGDGLLDTAETWLFGLDGIAATGAYANEATVVVADADLRTASDSDRNHHYGYVVGPLPSVDLEKAINAVDPLAPTASEDADIGPGPLLLVGSDAVWTYRVENTGPSELTVDALVDDAGTVSDPSDDFAPTYVSGDVDGNGFLSAGETWLFRATGVVTAGDYVNRAVVTVSDLAGRTATDSDLAHYRGLLTPPPAIGISLQKAVNAADPLNPTAAEDANDTPLALREGTALVWTYLLGNTGEIGLTVDKATAIVDDHGTTDASDDFSPVYVGGDLDDDGMLDTEETWLFTSQGAVTASAGVGSYVNTANAVAHAEDGRVATDSDIARILGIEPPTASIQLVKAVNAVNVLAPTSIEDANAVPGPLFLAGTDLVWTYLLSNTGDVELTIDPASAVIDDNGTPDDVSDDFAARYVSGDADRDGRLDVGETWLFTSEGVVDAKVAVGDYGNAAAAFASYQGKVVTDTDLAHHHGVANGDAAGLTPGFWKTNAQSWGASAWPRDDSGALIYQPGQRVGDVFDVPAEFAALADLTLVQALDLNGGGANALMRHAVAALLNATREAVAYPALAKEVIDWTETALASGSKSEITQQKDRFARWNERGADLDQHNVSPSYLDIVARSEIYVPWLLADRSTPDADDYLVYDAESGQFRRAEGTTSMTTYGL